MTDLLFRPMGEDAALRGRERARAAIRAQLEAQGGRKRTCEAPGCTVTFLVPLDLPRKQGARRCEAHRAAPGDPKHGIEQALKETAPPCDTALKKAWHNYVRKRLARMGDRTVTFAEFVRVLNDGRRPAEHVDVIGAHQLLTWLLHMQHLTDNGRGRYRMAARSRQAATFRAASDAARGAAVANSKAAQEAAPYTQAKQELVLAWRQKPRAWNRHQHWIWTARMQHYAGLPHDGVPAWFDARWVPVALRGWWVDSVPGARADDFNPSMECAA